MDETLIIRPATWDDAPVVAATMRADDVRELQAGTGHTPLEAIHIGLQDSAECWCALVGARRLAVWGVVGSSTLLTRGAGVGWLLTSHWVDRYPMLFWRACQNELRRLLDTWSVLVNCIDARHGRALRWAKRLGFRLEEPSPFGASGMMFCRFAVTKEDLRCVSH